MNVPKEAALVTLKLFKVMIPIILVMKLLTELGLTELLGRALAPVMELVGLPGAMGLAWAAAMTNSIYAGLAALAEIQSALPPDQALTQAQATVLACLMLTAHNLGVEGRIAHQAGASIWFQIALRLIGGFVFGLFLHVGYSTLGVLQAPAELLIRVSADTGLAGWALGQLRNLGLIFLVILALMFVLRIFDLLGVTRLVNGLLRPALRLIGVSPEASTVTVIGMTLGLAYGGGLIVHEATSGRLTRQDALLSLSLMAICHSVIEDTLLVALAGGHVSGVLWARIVFALISTALLARLLPLLPERLIYSSVHASSVHAGQAVAPTGGRS